MNFYDFHDKVSECIPPKKTKNKPHLVDERKSKLRLVRASQVSVYRSVGAYASDVYAVCSSFLSVVVFELMYSRRFVVFISMEVCLFVYLLVA